MIKTALYRHYDANGGLLYIGIARRVVERTAQHEKRSRWAEDIARIDVEWHNSRDAALKAEAAAIAEEHPKHNKFHNSQSPVAGIAARLGQRSIASTLGVSVSAVSRAVVQGAFPPAWYPVIRDMCAQQQVDCCLGAFGFKARAQDHSRPLVDGGQP